MVDEASGARRVDDDDRQRRFAEVYDAWSAAILAYAWRRTGAAEDAADVVADTFVVAWRRIDDMPVGDAAKPWLYGVARRVLANHHRSGRRRRRLEARVITEIAAVAPVDARSTELPTAAIAAAFARLEQRDRELLTLVGWDDLPRDEVAAIVGTSRASLRVRLHRARRRFEQLLAEEGVHPDGRTDQDRYEDVDASTSRETTR